MDFETRIEVIKIYLVPRLLYLFQSIPQMIPETQLRHWDKLVSRFIWAGKKLRVRYKTLELPKEEGGLSLPNLKQCSSKVPGFYMLPSISGKMERHKAHSDREF